jgi:non-ribosomal peptide synthetase component F
VCPGLAHRTVSGAPPDSVRCTRERNSELLTFRNSGSRSAIIHRTVRCASGATATSRQRSSAEDIKCATVRGCARRSQSTRQKAHRTVSRTCPVHHRTVRWPKRQKLQWSESNGRVTWLAHRTVSGGAPDYPVRHATAASTNGSFGGWGYKYPNHPPFIASKFSAFTPHTRAIAFNTRHKQEIKSSLLGLCFVAEGLIERSDPRMNLFV